MKTKDLTKDLNNIIIGILSIVLFLAPLLVFPRMIGFLYNYEPYVFVFDENIPKVIVLYTCGLALFVMLIIKRKQIKYDKKDILVLGFLLLTELSLIFSINKQTSLFGENGRYEGFLMILTYVLIYYFTKYYFKEYKYFYKILFGIVIGICVLAILQFYDLAFFERIFGIQRTKYWTPGTFVNPNFLGSYITLFLPILMCLFILKGEKKYLLMSGIVFLAMLCSLTRSAWVAFIIYSIIGIIYIFYKREKVLFKNGIILLSTFILIFIIGNILSGGRIIGRNKVMFNEIKNAASQGIKKDMGSGRIEIWKVVLNEIKLHPLLGTGVDTLKDAIIQDQYEYYLEGVEKYGKYTDKAHNEYLQIAATMGIPALIVYMLFLFFIIKDNMKNIFKNKIILILSLSIIGYLIQAFFNISTIGVAPVFWMILGLIQNEEFKEQALQTL